jgi:putative ABC transport system permease protein
MLNDENSALFRFAWKSIRRNAGRSFFIAISVSLAVFIAVWVVAFFDGLNHQIELAVVNTNTGYFQLQEKKFSETTDSSHPLEFNSHHLQILGAPVKSFSPELVLDANISTPEGATGLVVIGIVPDYHATFLPIKQNIMAGTYLNNDISSGIIIGKELAKLFSFRVGDQMILNYQDVNGELRSELLPIQGIYHYNSKGYEKRFVYVNQPTWQELFFKEEKGRILFNRIAIMTDDMKAETSLKERTKPSDLIFKSWKDLNPEMAVVLEFHDGMIRFFFLIIGLTIIMTILTPVQMLWQERLKELKMLNIIGVSKNKFWKIGLFEILQMIFCSGMLASLILTIIIGIQSRTGIDFKFLHEGVSIERAGIKLPAVIYPHLTVQQIIITFIFVIIILSVSYLWSIHRTLKKLEGPA